MSIKEKAALKKAEKMAARYNLSLNLFWTVLILAPVFSYFYLNLSLRWLWIIIPACFLPWFLPAALLDRFAAGRSRQWYERLGIHVFLHYVQQGRRMNRYIRKRYPDYRVVRNNATVRRKINETYMFERFHLGLLLAIFILLGHSVKHAYWNWAVVLLLCNIVYNIYPILLQQYIRLRLSSCYPSAESTTYSDL